MQTRMVFSMALCMLCPCGLMASETKEDAQGTFQNDQEKISYAIGINIGENLKNTPADIHLDTVLEAIRAGYTGEAVQMNPQEVRDTLQAFSRALQQKQQAKNKIAAEKNLREGQAFLAENKKREGVQTTDSGLQYIILREGDGPKPTKQDRVSVHYRGTLIDGREFDSSYQRGRPAALGVGGVIPGWTEALQMMRVGSKYKLFIPADLAYGPRQTGRIIGPNSTLIFEVELLEILK